MGSQRLLRTRIPAYTGGAARVEAGDSIALVDVEGQQVGDLWAIDANDNGLWLSVSHTRDRLERLFPTIGQSFTDQHGEPLLEYIRDTSPGKHDTLFAPCDRWLYESQGLTDHPNCRDNFTTTIEMLGIHLPYVPDPVNIFQNSSPSPDGELHVAPAISKAGDFVEFRALRTLYVVVTACSVDYWPTNGDRCTALELEMTTNR